MKRKSISVLLSAVLCTGCASRASEPTVMPPIYDDNIRSQQEDTTYPYGLFLSKCELSDTGEYIFPDDYAGVYVEYEDESDLRSSYCVFLFTTDDVSRYQYLKDAFPKTEFKTEKYSYNYLKNVLDDYRKTCDIPREHITASCVDISLNRAVVEVDEETLATVAFDEEDPLIFRKGDRIFVL